MRKPSYEANFDKNLGRQNIRRGIERRDVVMHPFCKANIEKWEEHEGVKLAIFG